MEGQTFSHYQVLERLGGGGMGVVYKALDTTLDRHVALKFLPPELTRDDEARRRFVQEAKAASALDHPNVCAIHEIASTPDDQLFIAMGYYAGETLKQRVARGPLPVAAAIDIIRQVGEGLAEAHAAGIVHRDIKPANIILTKSGLVKILDFGIAKLTGATGLTETGITLGTVSYMSPEQVNGENAGPQSDVWALGAVFYELLTGQPPFPGDRPAVVLHGITDRAPAPVRGFCPDASPDIVRVVTGALEKSRARRYATVGDFLAAISAAGATEALEIAALSGADVTRSTEATIGPGMESSDRPSIAVLPFADMSPGKDQDYFCEGLAEELIDALARLEGLRVVARTSAFRFKGDAPDLREVGQKLNVTTVLEGSVRKAGNRLRINAQLINVADGYHLWTERYDRELDDVFAVQDEIARAVVTKLKVKLLGAPEQALVVRPTESLEAYACYMQGRHYRFSRYNVAKASRFFEEAVRHDPGYVAAWAGVAEAAVLAGIFVQQRPQEASVTARAAVERALTLDDDVAEAHDAAAKIHFWFDWRWDDAEREFARAIELNPSNAGIYASYGHFLAYMGRTDMALAQAAKAGAIDPLSTRASVVAGYALVVGCRYEEAITAFRQALELQPDLVVALWHLSLSYAACDKPEEAVAVLRQVSGATARSAVHLAFCGHALAGAGQESEAKQCLTALRDRVEHEYVAPFLFAFVHAGLGEFEKALDYLEDAYAERSPELIFLQRPDWAPLRHLPRFQALRRRVGLPDVGPPRS